jgi:hypothetical protein
MTSPRVFTIEEVNALIPRLSRLVGTLLLQQSEIEGRLAELTRLCGSLPQSLESAPDDSFELGRLKSDLRDRLVQYESGWHEVQKLGVLVKDPQIGLLDFYGRVDGRLVFLCWRYGEDSLSYFHDLTAGYAGRQRLKAETRERLLN